jgi:hypothetical protein
MAQDHDDLIEQADRFARLALELVAAENATAALSVRAVASGFIQAAAMVMARQGIPPTDIAEHLRRMATSVEAQAGILRNLQ